MKNILVLDLHANWIFCQAKLSIGSDFVMFNARTNLIKQNLHKETTN